MGNNFEEQLNKISEMMKPIARAIEPMQKTMEELNEKISPIVYALQPLNDVFEKIQKSIQQIIPKNIDKIIASYNKSSKEIFDLTAKHQWFYNRKVLWEKDFDIEDDLIENDTNENIFDEIFINAYDKVLDNIFDNMKGIEKDEKIKNFIDELKYQYVNNKYFSCISSCQPIIEHALTRLNRYNRITQSKPIRNLIQDKFITEQQAFDMVNNSVNDLFSNYYYCDDSQYDINSQIPNRHFIAHGFGFNFVSQKGALNMIILLSIIYDDIDFLHL